MPELSLPSGDKGEKTQKIHSDSNRNHLENCFIK